MRRVFMFLAIITLMIFIGLYALVRYLECTAVFFPSKVFQADPSQMSLPYEDVYFKTSDGITLNGWWLKNPGATSTLLFMHGNAGNISDRLLKVKSFYDLGLNVFIFDYRGYGKSEGKPSEQGLYIDGQAAYDYLKSRTDMDMGRVIVYGASLGGGVSVDLAVHRPVVALVIDSSFTSAQDMAKLLYPHLPSFLISIKFNSMAKVGHLAMPKLFLHSPDDHVVPFDMGRRLYEAAAEPKTFMRVHGGHNDAQIATDPQAAKEFVQFLKSAGLL